MEQADKNYVWDDRAPSFGQVADVLVVIARDECDFTVDPTTHTRWQEALMLLREFDTYHDDMAPDPDDALDELVRYNELRALYPSLAPENLDADLRSDLIERVRRILKIGAAVGKTVIIEDFVELRLAEAQETADIIQDLAAPETVSLPAFNEQFMPIVRSMSATACLLDSLMDAKADLYEGKIAIPITSEYRRAIRHELPRHVRPALGALAHRAVLWEFAKMSGNRLANRLRHGKTASSSLRNVPGFKAG